MHTKLPALFIGRFQPFHLGHSDAISQILEKEEAVIIAIGSATEDFLLDNPFTASERYQMIDVGLEAGARKKVAAIIPVPDIHNSALWVSYVCKMVPPFGNVHTGSAFVKQLFVDDGKHTVFPLEMRKKITATGVREALLKGKEWQSQVAPPVAKLLVSWDIEKRLKEINHPA